MSTDTRSMNHSVSEGRKYTAIALLAVLLSYAMGIFSGEPVTPDIIFPLALALVVLELWILRFYETPHFIVWGHLLPLGALFLCLPLVGSDRLLFMAVAIGMVLSGCIAAFRKMAQPKPATFRHRPDLSNAKVQEILQLRQDLMEIAMAQFDTETANAALALEAALEHALKVDAARMAITMTEAKHFLSLHGKDAGIV